MPSIQKHHPESLHSNTSPPHRNPRHKKNPRPIRHRRLPHHRQPPRHPQRRRRSRLGQRNQRHRPPHRRRRLPLADAAPSPPEPKNSDFRGIQAFDENTAIVMSSGKGDLSRLYKTTDGCQTWKLLFTNPDKEGFWDAIKFARLRLATPRRSSGSSSVDLDNRESVSGLRAGQLSTAHRRSNWYRLSRGGADGKPLFAASNSSFLNEPTIFPLWNRRLSGERILLR